MHGANACCTSACLCANTGVLVLLLTHHVLGDTSILTCSEVILICIQSIAKSDGASANAFDGIDSWDQYYLTGITTRFVDETFGGVVQMLCRNN